MLSNKIEKTTMLIDVEVRAFISKNKGEAETANDFIRRLLKMPPLERIPGGPRMGERKKKRNEKGLRSS